MGIVLSNQWLLAIMALIVWLILRQLKPSANSAMRLATSIQLGSVFLACVPVAIGMIPPLPSIFIEVVAISVIAMLLFFNGTPAWAYVLIIHAGYIVVARISDLRTADFTAIQQRSVVGTIAIQLFAIWMLITYLRQLRLLLSQGQSDAQSTKIPQERL